MIDHIAWLKQNQDEAMADYERLLPKCQQKAIELKNAKKVCRIWEQALAQAIKNEEK